MTTVVERLSARREKLARVALERIIETVPVYARLPEEQLEGEVKQLSMSLNQLSLAQNKFGFSEDALKSISPENAGSASSTQELF